METGRTLAAGARTGLETNGPTPGARCELRALRRGLGLGKTIDLTEAAMEEALRETAVEGRVLVVFDVSGRVISGAGGAGP